MADESLTTPEKAACNHRWRKVEGTTSPQGGLVVMCTKCSATRDLDPPIKEQSKDTRPLLQEG